jgi:hypothetical protein
MFFFPPSPPYSLPPWYKQMEVCGFNGGFKSGWGKSSPYPAFWDGRSLIHDFWVSVWVKCCPKTVFFLFVTFWKQAHIMFIIAT